MSRTNEAFRHLDSKFGRLHERTMKLFVQLEARVGDIEKTVNDYITSKEELVCPVCGGKVSAKIDKTQIFERNEYKGRGEFEPIYETAKTLQWYTVSCDSGCVSMRRKDLKSAIEGFKAVKCDKAVGEVSK